MSSMQSPCQSRAELIQALLDESTTTEPKIIVLVVDEKGERLLDVGCEPITDIAVLLSLHGVKPDPIRSHSTEINQ